MGVRPAPLAATARMNKLQQSSIYCDLRLRPISTLFGIFYDDIEFIAPNKRKAELVCRLIEQQDEKGLIKLVLEYPETSDEYTAYLNTEVRITKDGTLDSRLFRKTQKKLLTLNSMSHHSSQIVEHTIRNMYDTARDISSSDANTQHSIGMVDRLLLNNGHKHKALDKLKNPKTKKKKRTNRPKQHTNATLKIPHLSDKCTADIKRAAKDCFLPIRVVTTPGRKLGQILTSSKPRDPINCPNSSCKTCDSLTRGKCTTPNTVYRMTCEVPDTQTNKTCNTSYCGETYRPLSNRFTEHYRAANNPTCKSHKNKTIAKHYNATHPGVKPKLKLDIVDRGSSTRNRLVKEARLILREKPELNCKNEQIHLAQYLI